MEMEKKYSTHFKLYMQVIFEEITSFSYAVQANERWIAELDELSSAKMKTFKNHP